MGSHHHHHPRISETSYISESAAPSSSSCSGHINSMLKGMNHPTANTTIPLPALYMNQGGSSLFDFEELERAIVLNHSGGGGHHLHLHDDMIKSPAAGAALYTTGEGRPATATTLEMFPSWPIKYQQQHHHNTTRQQQEVQVQQQQGSWNAGGAGRESITDDDDDDSGSAVNTVSSSRIETSTHFRRGGDERESPPISSSSIRRTGNQIINGNNISQNQQQLPSSSHQEEEELIMMTSHIPKTGTGTGFISQNQSEQKRGGSGSTRSSEKPLDAKTLRRLAQNREAAKKSRLRKKAYVQQLESSRIKLAQLEQDLQRARAQGLFAGGGAPTNISSGAAIFDMEYARWLDDDHRRMSELRTGLQSHLSDTDLRLLVDGCINHYDEIFRLKGVAAKSDVFHLITGMWTTPAERCFLWMGGFRPSELIKMLRAQLDPLTEQQMMGIHSLQESSQQAEEALTQGLEQLQQSLVDTIAATTLMDGMQQMAVALGKLSSLEGFVRQADNLRQQTLHQLCRILTVRQAARCFLMIGEYYGRLRALSSLWSSRPKQSMMGDDNQATLQWQMMLQQQQQTTSQTHFLPF